MNVVLGLLEFGFWTASVLAVFPYLGYPTALMLVRRLSARRPASAEPPVEFPTVTVVVSAHDEEAVIEQKITTTLAADYPADRLSVIVVSDASTDGTNDIVRGIAANDPRVSLIELVEHVGKTMGLNRAMEVTDSEVVVFTDANAIFDKDALRHIVTELNAENVGYVVGSQLYSEHPGSSAGGNEGLYWRYELSIKKLESEIESVVGGDGAIYGIWRRLYQPLAAEDINDFVNPLQIITGGYRGVFSELAIAYEDPANDFAKEFRRKRRIVCRTWGALLRFGIGRVFAANRRFAIMLVSHKVIRWFTLLWIAFALMFNITVLAAGGGGIYVLTLGLSLLTVALALVGWRKSASSDDIPGYFAVPYYFYLSNLAALLGIVDYALGNRYVTWQHVRS